MSIKILSCHPIFNENALALSQKYNFPVENIFSPKNIMNIPSITPK